MNNLIASGKRCRVILADCIEAMAGMEENSIDAVVCDPPYALGFMGKAWDRFPTDKGPKKPFANRSREGKLGGHPFQEWCQAWSTEALRVAKPGAYLLAFGGTRTFHRLACGIEDAGWVLKDTLSWNYGSGFPKSHDISKALDRKAGAEREVVGPNKWQHVMGSTPKDETTQIYGRGQTDKRWETAPATPEAKQWDGWGTALKPSWEPIVLAQAPLEGTYAENVLKWGCGALNIDRCRIGLNNEKQPTGSGDRTSWRAKEGRSDIPASDGNTTHKQGRWPANFLLSHSLFCAEGACVPDCPVAILDGQSGVTKSTGGKNTSCPNGSMFGVEASGVGANAGGLGDRGGASRFFYCAKASREERNAGLEAVHTLFEKWAGFGEKAYKMNRPPDSETAPMINRNPHPTVKPIALMRYLCRLVTPPGGMVLDPFAGSGSTGCAAALEGFQSISIEKEREYAEIARARIAHFSERMP